MHPHEARPPVARHDHGMNPARVVLVDDHVMITEALAARLSAAADLWVAGRCTATDPRLAEKVRGLRPDVIVVETAPWGDRLGEVLRALIAARPEARLIVLSSDHEVRHAVEAARAGVSAWVAKEQGTGELERVLRGVAQGESWFPPHLLG